MQKILFYHIFTGIFLFSFFSARAQKDTLVDIQEEQLNLEANLDSMLNLWYVDKYVNAEKIHVRDSIVFADSLFPEFPDSVYIDRISRIPSVVNLSYNQIVKRFIEVYTMKRRNTVEVMLGLSDYYFPLFDDIFDYYEVPNELKYMSIIESALNPRAYSRARAVGLWQFMYGTGRIYGLSVNSLVDERRDPMKSTHAAVRFIKDLHGIYNDWLLAIAAYNCGPGNVNKAIRRAGGRNSFWDVYYYLPRETRGHVPAFIAATYVMHYYNEHNLSPRAIDLPIPADTVIVHDDLHLAQVSSVLQIPMKQLKDMNPQYLREIIPGRSNPCALVLPQEKTTAFIDLEDSVYTYLDSIYFPNKQVATPRSYSGYHAPPPKNSEKCIYTVKSGDNLGFISEWYNVRISDIKYWNNIRRNTIYTGQKLHIYVPDSKADRYRDIDKLTFNEKQRRAGNPVASASTSSSSSSVQTNLPDDNYIYYTIKSGDTLWEIALQFEGVSDSDLMRLNSISRPSDIRPGQKIKVKLKG
ncbi:MAG: LysM peptidoglycan-binding domain-containing protein [Bacteroidales bacterium]